MKIPNLMLLGTVMFLSGCATIFSGTTQEIDVEVADADNLELLQDVRCAISTDKGPSQKLMTNPGQIIVKKGQGALRFDCKKEGYTQQNVGSTESVNGVTFVNVLFWPGFIVDAATGSMQEYPSRIKILMSKDKPSLPPVEVSEKQ